jgi:hypothetical protein
MACTTGSPRGGAVTSLYLRRDGISHWCIGWECCTEDTIVHAFLDYMASVLYWMDDEISHEEWLGVMGWEEKLFFNRRVPKPNEYKWALMGKST